MNYFRQLSLMQKLDRQQWSESSRIKDIQSKLLHEMINTAYNHSLFYKNIMDERGIKPDDIQTEEDLRKLPVVSKKDIFNEMKNGKLLPEQYASGGIVETTSGTTGIPLKIIWTASPMATPMAISPVR